MTKSDSQFIPSDLFAHVTHVYARYEAPIGEGTQPLTWSATLSPPVHKGLLKIVLELDRAGKDSLQAHLGKSDFTAIQEQLLAWLEPKTKQYALAAINGGNLLHTSPRMLIKV